MAEVDDLEQMAEVERNMSLNSPSSSVCHIAANGISVNVSSPDASASLAQAAAFAPSSSCLAPSSASDFDNRESPVQNTITAPNASSDLLTAASSVSANNPAITASLTTNAISSLLPTAAKLKKGKKLSSGKVNNFVLTNVSSSSPSGSISSSAVCAEQLTSVTDADLSGDNPQKLLQAVRSTTLPFPLPVPTYSQAVQAARASGNVLTERATIIRETVKFFLNHKYWWTSEDYDRIAELVVNEFPELRDPIVWPTTPCYSKVRLDLSMCARNIRRIAKNQEKRRGSPRHHSVESSETEAEPSAKSRKGSSKGGRRGDSQVSHISPTMVAFQPVGQMLPHTAQTSQAVIPTTSSALEQKEAGSLPYLLTSTPVSSSSTVLPPVAHFLAHPSVHSHSPGGIVFPSLLPATLSLTSDTATSALASPISITRNCHADSNGGMAMPELMTRHDSIMDSSSLAAAWRPDAQLPEPLPVPPYSEKVMKAKKMGVTKFERPLIIRETVLFFLSLKYWWSSVDYDRISDFVVDYFPDLKDPLLSPNMPPNRRVRTDLSQTARNIRRREVMLRRRDNRSTEDRFAAVGTVTIPQGIQQPSTDFCNELLAAASIIESRTAALHQEDVAKALELHAEVSREVDAKSGVITHTQTLKDTESAKTEANISKVTSSVAIVGKEHVSEAVKYPYNFSSANELSNQDVEPSKEAVVNTQLAVIKKEIGDDEVHLDQYQALQASQAWFSAQMSQALSMQALTGLSAQMSQALSVAQISEQLMSSQGQARCLASQSSTPPAAHQSSSGIGTSNGGSVPGQNQSSLSLQQLSQVGGYNSPNASALSDNNLADSTHVDRMSAMAMWRSTCLPDPLPNPPYSLNVLRARDSGNTASARPRIIRETTQFFLAMKMWWTTQDYERIAELVLRQFPALKTVQNIKKDLGTCARNMRRRLPLSRNKQWAGYQSPQHAVLKEDGTSESAGLTLGELANMASLREAQDKGRIEATGLAALTEEQRQTLLAHSVYEQNTLTWNTLYQQQFPSPAETVPVLPQGRNQKKIQKAITTSKGTDFGEKEISETLKQTAIVHSSNEQYGETESIYQQPVNVSERIKVRGLKEAADGKGGQRPVISENLKSDIYPVMKELVSLSVLSSKKLSTEPAVFQAAQVQHMSAMADGLVHAHQTPVRAHSQSGTQDRSKLNAMEEEVPMNLTCGTEVSKQSKSQKQIKSEPKFCKNGPPSVETFSAREQVWFPHGSPWKKSGQNVFKALPNPLPMPKYSQKLIKAHDEGLAFRHRSEIIRETARFFLGFKYWWSSADYSRISELVVLQFPELKDPVIHPGQPCYRRVQRDLSMCARNLRRKNTRRQQLSAGETNSSGFSKRLKNGSSKDKKARKDGDTKKESTSDANDARQPDSKLHLEQPPVAGASAGAPSTHALFQAASDQVFLSRLNNTALPVGHVSKLTADSLKLTDHPVVDKVHTTVSPIYSLYSPVISSAVHSAPLSVSSCGVGLHKHTNMVDKAHLPKHDRHSSIKETVLLEKGIAKKELNAANGSLKPSSHPAAAKAVKFVAPSAHRQENQDADRAVSLTTSGLSRRAAGAKCNKDSGRHSHLTSRSTFSDPRTLSNTTAIVTPTLSEAHATDSRISEGSVSDKVYINPEHGSELQSQLIKLWQEGKFFDASLEVDDYRLPVHKLVLLAASPYLQSTFRHANPTSHLEVNLPRDTGVEAARDFLKYIYQGVLHIAPETVNALRRIAAMLQIDQLLSYCDDYICRLTDVSTSSHSHHNTVSHSTPQVPRVSVNLRDPAHSHSLATDQSSVNLTNPALDFNSGRGSVSVGSVQYLQGESTSSRKRSVFSSVAGQPFYAHYGADTDNGGIKAHIVQAESEQCGRKEELSDDIMIAKRLRPATAAEIISGDQALATMVLGQHAGVAYQNVMNNQQLHLIENHIDTLQQHSALVQHHISDKVANRAHSSVIQHGPNVIRAPTHLLSQSEQADDSVNDSESAAHFLPESGDCRQLTEDSLPSAQSQMTDSNVMVTLLPQTDVEVEVGEEMQVESSHTFQHLPGEEGQVVEEVVVDTGDLLQDVEVAACETVECSLLPQTYCSSPEDSQTLSSRTDNALQSIASQWAAQQYVETSLDVATAQQFVAVLQERMYGHSTSPSNQDQQSQQETNFEQQSEVYMQECADTGAVYVNTQPQPTAHELVVETSTIVNSPTKQTASDDQASLLPQTYCSSPQPAHTDSNTHTS